MTVSQREIIRTSREDVQMLKKWAEGVGNGEYSARRVARLAVYAGMLLIGTTHTKAVHRPVKISQHRYIDLRDDHKVKQIPETAGHDKMLHAGKNADVAIMSAIFGDANSRLERKRRCEPFTGRDTSNFGWGIDLHKTEMAYLEEDLMYEEDAVVHTHARPELINAALGETPLVGSIDCVYDDESFQHVGYDIAQYVGPKARRTIVSIPISSDVDLPLDIIPTNYDDMHLINR